MLKVAHPFGFQAFGNHLLNSSNLSQGCPFDAYGSEVPGGSHFFNS